MELFSFSLSSNFLFAQKDESFHLTATRNGSSLGKSFELTHILHLTCCQAMCEDILRFRFVWQNNSMSIYNVCTEILFSSSRRADSMDSFESLSILVPSAITCGRFSKQYSMSPQNWWNNFSGWLTPLCPYVVVYHLWVLTYFISNASCFLFFSVGGGWCFQGLF